MHTSWNLKKYGNKLKIVLNGYYGTKINLKAYGIPIVTTILSSISYKPDGMRLKIANTFEFICNPLTTLICFHNFLTVTCLHAF